jgi:hypothetical protein
LKLDIRYLASGSIRVKISQPNIERWQPLDLLLANAKKFVEFVEVKSEKNRLPEAFQFVDPSLFSALRFPADNRDLVLVIEYAPFRLTLYDGNVAIAAANHRQLLHYERDNNNNNNGGEVNLSADSKSKEDKHKGKEIVDYGEDGESLSSSSYYYYYYSDIY